jgi:hypothetical protein
MHIHVADTIEMPNDWHAGFLLNTGHQAFTATRHHHIDDTSCREQGTDHGTIARGNQLNRSQRQARRCYPLYQTRVQRR